MSVSWAGQVTRVPHPTHAYLCSNGHYQTAPFELKTCQVYRKGSPCMGEMREVGRGKKRG